MTNRQFNKLKMCGAVISVLQTFASLIQTIPAFQAVFTKFQNYYNAILIKSNLQQTSSLGKTEARDLARSELTKVLFIVMKGLKLYSKSQNDMETQNLCSAALSDLDYMRDIEFKNRASLILEKALPVKTNLVQYGIEESKITELESKITSFSNSLDVLNGGEAGKISATSNIQTLFKEMDALLKEIDDYADIFDDKDPNFRSVYDAARVIKDLGTSHEKKEEVKEPQPA